MTPALPAGPTTYFDTPGSPTYPDAKMFIQTAAGGRAEYDSANSGNNANFDLAAGEDAALLPVGSPLATTSSSPSRNLP